MAHEVAVTADHGHGNRQYYVVWVILLVLTAVEVMLAYQHLKLTTMLGILLGLSFVKAAMIIGYFMHLKFEVSRMKWVLMTSLLVCLSLMAIFFPDAIRVLNMGIR